MSELKPFDEFIDALVHCDTVKVILTGCGESTFETKPIHEGICALANRRSQPANEPLTLDELREMDGEPVWVVDTKHPEDSGWMQYGYYSAEFYMIAFWMFGSEVESTYSVDNYGKTWLAYRRKPEGSENE